MHPRLLPLLLTTACLPLPEGFGEHPADQAQLSEAKATAHLARSLPDGGAGLSVSDYLMRTPEFITAPDPTPLFAEVHREQRSMVALEGEVVELTVLSYNVALLDRYYLGNHVLSPHIGDRFATLVSTVFSGEYDVVLLQEVWENRDLEVLRRVGQANGYTVWGGEPDTHEQHGLAMAVRTDLIDPDAPQEQLENQFLAQRKLERWPGPNVKRGWLTWGFTIASSEQRVWFVDLHATSYPQYEKQRNHQARQVGLHVQSVAAGAPVLIGGDFNSGPYYDDDIWWDDTKVGWRGWWDNASAYALWLHYAEALDVFSAVGIPGDVKWAKDIPFRPPEDLTYPYGEEGWCDARDEMPFTGTDCNSLYRAQYGGTEAPARLDHLLLRDPEHRVRVERAQKVFVDPLPIGEGGAPIELSDHYGIEATVQVKVD